MEGPHLFRKQENAENYLRDKLLEFCEQELAGRTDTEANEMERELEEAADLETIEGIAEELAKGEYVIRRLSWELKEINFAD